MHLSPSPTENNRRRQISKAMKSSCYACPKCNRGQNKRPLDLIAEGVGLLWVCVYCKHEWTAGSRSPTGGQ